MKLVSIMMLGFVLSVSNVAAANTQEKKLSAEEFKQAQTQMLGGVSAHIEVMNKFKSCVEKASTGPGLRVCMKNKKQAVKALRKNNKGAKAGKPVKAKKPKPVE